jgi:integrase
MAEHLIEIREANESLKGAGCRVVVEDRGGWLWLRGTLPPKPGSDKKLPHQQRIRLGVRASVAGLQVAVREAKRVSVLLDRKEFDWCLFGEKEIELTPVVGDVTAQFVRDYWLTHERTPASETTLRDSYLEYFKKLPQKIPLTLELMVGLVEETKPNSRQRQKVCLALGQLAKLANIPFDPKPYWGNYQPKERNVPTDDEILQAWEKVNSKNIPWSNVLLLLAVYGCRAHEVFYLDMTRFPILRVTEGKTGKRDVYPYPKEWLNFLEQPVILPQCSHPSHRELGHRVTTQFRRYELPFRPHDLRHAHAIRMIGYRVPVEIAARYHGHSTQVHTNIYQRWMSQQTLDQTWLETNGVD